MAETAASRGTTDGGWFFWLIGGAFALIAGSYLVLLNLDTDTARSLAREDAAIEQAGAAFFLAAAALFVVCYFRSDSANRFFGISTGRNVWFLLLAALMFVCFGEEISWGQRIFGWQTPLLFDSLNAQGETNLHNLWLFHGRDEDGERRSFMALLLNANRLLSIFWLTYCFVVPLLAYASGFFRRVAGFFGFPIPPIAIGLLFIVNYVVLRGIVALGEPGTGSFRPFDELKESIYGLCFFVLALYFVGMSRRRGYSR